MKGGNAFYLVIAQAVYNSILHLFNIAPKIGGDIFCA